MYAFSASPAQPALTTAKLKMNAIIAQRTETPPHNVAL
jgi:hypothetical protein